MSLHQGSSTPTPGVTGAGLAPAGSVGELITASLPSASAIALTTAVTANVTSITLTPGAWDVVGVVDYVPAATTSISAWAQGVSSTSATFGAQDTFTKTVVAAQVPTAINFDEVSPPVRFNLAASTTIYLVTQATFTVSTLSAYGTIRATRVY